jgi:pSer/pThr/pTyr-binding forkhead associated (FHA) protein
MMKVIRIGRGSDNDVVIKDDTVSYSHTQIAYDGTLFKILDLDSTNGTYVNGKRIADFTEVQLFLSDTVRVGKTDLPWHQYFAHPTSQPQAQPA